MKNKDIKKRFRKRIDYGWRAYLPIRINKKHFGVGDLELPTAKNVAKLTNLVESGEESGLVNHHCFIDPSKSVDGAKWGVTIQFHIENLWDDDEEKNNQYISNLKEWYGDFDYVRDENTYYFVTSVEGLLNPKYVLEDNLDSDEPYYLNDVCPEHYVFTGDEAFALIELFRNGETIKESVLHEELLVKNDNIKNRESIDELCHDLCSLGVWTKTEYFDFDKDDVIITYAIRYRENVGPFLKDLKTLVKKYKHIKF